MKKTYILGSILIIYLLFIISSYFLNYGPGQAIGVNFLTYARNMFAILPVVFILIGLFEVWIPRETVEAHMGEGSKITSYLWGILLAGLAVGGIFIAFPIACTLYRKGAKLSVIFFYVSCASVCRIPMTMYEAAFLGLKFTLIRLAIALPLLFLISVFIGKYLEGREYEIVLRE
ncbi:MAG: permease [Candidatus Margulisiibacteriota bacterium]